MLNPIDWQKLKQIVSQFTKNKITKQRIDELDAFDSKTAANKQVKDVLSAQELLSDGERPSLSSLDLVSLWLRRLNKGAVLNPIELRDVRFFLSEASYIYNIFKDANNSWIASFTLNDFSKILDRIDKTIDVDANILSDASPTLSKLNKEKKQISKSIQNKLSEIVNKQGPEDYLQDKFVTTREGRWVVPVKQGMQGKFKGIIHDISNTGQSIFIEPEAIVSFNNDLRQIEVAIKKEIEAILKAITYDLKQNYNELTYAYEALKEIDYIFSLAAWNERVDGHSFEFSSELIELNQCRNPMLVFEGEKVVSNTISMDSKKSVLLVSGPNAGGKTVLLKSLGLAAQMARSGLPICAEPSSKIPFFNKIYISLGDAQNIKEGLSTFAAHIEELKEAYHAEGLKDLVLIDEICGSTDPEEGAAIARAFLTHFASKKIFNLTTSHLSPLKSNWSDASGVQIGSMDYDESLGLPNYKLIIGISGSSFAWKTAEKLGVPKDILESAKDFLSEDWKEQQKKTDRLEVLRQDLINEKNESEAQKNQAMKAKKEYHDKLADLEKQKDRAINDFIKEAEERLNKYLDDLKEKKNTNVYEIKADLPKIIKNAETKELSAEEFAEKFPAGTSVFITSLEKRGVVQSKPNNKGEVQVLSNSMHLSIPYRFLAKSDENTKAKTFKPISPSTLSSEDLELDLRGKTMEESLQLLEEHLDDALTKGSDRIKVIHGHGSGVLKKAIRNFCARSDYIKKWQIATKDKGGDGVTWIDL